MGLGYPAPYRRRPPSATARALDRAAPLRHLDWVLVLAVVALSALGTLLVWSATRFNDRLTGGDPDAFLKRHLLNLAIGLALAACTMLFDYRMLRVYAPFVYVLSIVGLLLVLSPLGQTINGSHSWIVIGGLSIQPSEFAKVALVAGAAMLLAEKRDAEDTPRDAEDTPRDMDVLLVLALAAVPTALVLLQPDVGTVMVLGAIMFGMIAVSGAPRRWIIGLLLAAVLGGVAVAQLGLLQQHQLDRFAAFANPELDPRGVGYNTSQARIAIGSGGLTGKGLFEGPQTNGQFVPEQQTDFIFTVAGEELGFVGAVGIVLLFGLLLWRALHIAANAEDLFGTLIAAGVGCWFAFQAFENIGMTVGIMPVTGLPLPFVSYGGSAIFANFMAFGLLQNVRLRRSARPATHLRDLELRRSTRPTSSGPGVRRTV
jgi:rod shape determining protein RodA